MKFPAELPISELEIGDVVQAFDGPFGTAIVIKRTDEYVTTFRPYATTSGFCYGEEPQTIPYTGSETMSYFRQSKDRLKVLERRPHK